VQTSTEPHFPRSRRERLIRGSSQFRSSVCDSIDKHLTCDASIILVAVDLRWMRSRPARMKRNGASGHIYPRAWHRSVSELLELLELFMTIANIDLEEQYRLTRAALVRAGLDMNGSIDALYRDWLRWREKPKCLAPRDRVAIGNADRWWALHLAQFRSLIDPVHVTARSVRACKDDRARIR
jgi:hypothetical protein